MKQLRDVSVERRIPNAKQLRYVNVEQKIPSSENAKPLRGVSVGNAVDVVRDPVLRKVDVLCFTETWNATDDVDVAGYAPAACTHGFQRPAGGVKIYVNRDVVDSVDLRLQLGAQQRVNGEHCVASVCGVDVMTMYLAPNLSRAAVEKYVAEAVEEYRKQRPQRRPFVIVGDFNVDVIKDDWVVQYMASRHSLKRATHDDKHRPTTVRGTCIDHVFANFDLRPLQPDPLTLHFTDHKAIVIKVPKAPQ